MIAHPEAGAGADSPAPTLATWRQRDPRAAIGAAMARIRAAGPDPAWISLATEQQLEQQLAWIEARPGAALPLRGVPFAVKDNIDVAGWVTTAACPAFAYPATRTARAVRKLLDAGAVLLGKTNLDQFATGLVGTRSPYGVVANPFDGAYIGGGSSSGSASVVTRGLVAFALGTDTAGSGRVPAGFNNLVGVKPTPGRVSVDGVVPACRTLDCLSIMALVAADAAQILALIEHAPGEALDEPMFNAVPVGPARFGAALFDHALRVGCPIAPEFYGDSAYAAAFMGARSHLQQLGIALEPIDLAPFLEVARLLYDGPWVAERYAVAAELIENRPEQLDPQVRAVIGAATRFSARDAFRAEYRRRELEVATRQAWRRCDLMMLPTAPTLPTLAAVAAQPLARNSELGYYTNFVNLLGLAAVAMPAGFTAAGLPFGVTFVAPGGSDAALLDFAARWEHSLQLPLGCHLGAHPGSASPAAAPGSAAAAASTAGASAAATGARIAAAPAPRAEATLALAVVGAHLEGLPLHPQLLERGARLLARTRTAPRYRLHALGSAALGAGALPKPGLARQPEGGGGSASAIEVEVYELPLAQVGSFLALVGPPLGLGSIELEDGLWVHGFICEPWALAQAPDISAHGGWRAYLAAQAAAAADSSTATTAPHGIAATHDAIDDDRRAHAGS